MKTAHSGKRLYVSKYEDEIRLAFRQGRRGMFRKFALNFSDSDDSGGECRGCGTEASPSKAKGWVYESDKARRNEAGARRNAKAFANTEELV